MLSPFFALAATSPGRQQTFRRTLVAHLGVMLGGVWALYRDDPQAGAPLLGSVLLVAGVVEGAALVGWRLTQLPRSQALEFLLVSPLRPRRLLTAEALVGLSRLGLVTLSGLPVLMLLAASGLVAPVDVAVLLVLPWTWGAATGLALTVWAYEPQSVRRWGERLTLALVLAYLAVGVLAGEHLRAWLGGLPPWAGRGLLSGFVALHTGNPFAVMRFWLECDPALWWQWLCGYEFLTLLGCGLLLARVAGRLQGHFHERHYQPVTDPGPGGRGRVGDRPLAWWAVRRVTQYSGRINLWLAGGFGGLYALYLAAGSNWPAWMGRQVFSMWDAAGGAPVLAAGLVVLAAVPAAFQYGLWDSNAQDRCRRLELLLLTRLQASDYWDAAAAAAWARGRGYFGVAAMLWLAALAAGRMDLMQVTAAAAAGVLLWAMYFALGFRAFTRGGPANGLGMLLTLGLPLLAYALTQAGHPLLAALAPPVGVYGAAAGLPALAWLPGSLLAAVVALVVARVARQRCDDELRRWYELHHGSKVVT